MELTALWPLAFLALIPFIVILYLLKQKGEESKVSSTLLWREALKNMEATTPWEKYKHNILMYLQILTLILLVAALIGPVIKHLGNDSNSVIIVIDNSASMNTLYDEDVTRLEEAKARAVEYVDSLDDACICTIISSAKGGVIEGSSLSSKRAMKSAVKNIEYTELEGLASDALDLVRSLSEDIASTDVSIFTDSALDLEGVNAQVISLYKYAANYSMDSVSYVSNDDGSITALANVTNHSDEDASIEVGLYFDGELNSVSDINVKANSSDSVYFENVKASAKLIEAEIETNDALVNDNKSGVLTNDNLGKRVLLVTSGNTFLEKALMSIKDLDIYKTADTDVVGKQEEYDLYVFDNVLPDEEIKDSSVIYINPPTSESLGSKETIGSSSLAFLNTEITEYLDKEEMVVTEATTFDRPLYAKSFLECDKECIGYYGMSDLGKVIVCGFDIHSSDVALKADFPILIYNMVTYSLDRGLVDNRSCVTGDKVNIISNGSDEDVKIVTPENREDSFDSSVPNKVYDKIDKSGLYKVTSGEEEDAFYASFPTKSESDVVSAVSEDSKTVGSDELPKGGRSAKKYVIYVLLFMLIVEWIIYVREY